MSRETVWKLTETDADLPLMARTLGISEIMARVMANRGIRSKKAALAYLRASMDGLHDPFLMKDMEKAVTLLSEAIAAREKITIYGDYDADGVTATVILYKTLCSMGADVSYYIPHRSEEGYGLNLSAVRALQADGCRWIVTVDNGIAALEEIAEAKRLGMRVIVVDHHEPGFTEADGQRRDILPDADAVVDPKQTVCGYPFKMLCAAGLAYKLAVAFSRLAGADFADNGELLALAAIGTVCDIVELRDENRVIVKNGLDILQKNKLINPGLGSLITRRGYLDKPIDTFVAGFVLGPCINATGRLESADLSARLLLADAADAPLRFELADKLTALNDERKALTTAGFERAMAIVLGDASKVLVLVDAETHESVAGIVAGRVKEQLNRPVIVLTRVEGAFKGSGRSVEGYNMFEALYRNRHLFLRFGGHAMAAGLTIAEENIGALRVNLNAECTLEEPDFLPKLTIDGVLRPEDVTLALANELNLLAPFGKGNREPLFVSNGLTAESLRVMDEKSTLIFTFLLENGKRLKGICFGLNDLFKERLEVFEERERVLLRGGMPRQAGAVVDAVYAVETNLYNGTVSVQLRIRDFVFRKR